MNFGVYYEDTLGLTQQVYKNPSIVKAIIEFNDLIKSRDTYDEGVELCFVDEEGLYLDSIYYENFPHFVALEK